MNIKNKLTVNTFLIALACSAPNVYAAQIESSVENKAQPSQSGYQEKQTLASANSVNGELVENDKERESIYAFNNLQTVFKPYFDWKRALKEKHELSFGVSAYWLYQESQASANDDTNAGGGVYRFQGSWSPLTLTDGSTGSLNFRVENRSEIGGLQAPATLGGAVSTSFNPGFGYSDNFSTDLAVFNWTQGFNNNKAGIAVGRLAFDAYLDAFAFQTFSRGFINRAFILSPTMGTTGIGAIGAVAKGYISDNLWLGAHIYDANAKSGEFDLDTFQEGEWLSALEFGWTPSQSRQKTDRIQLTYWQKDARELAGTSKGDGWLLSASYQVADGILPFLRYGQSDGGAGVAATKSFSTGVDIATSATQNLSVGVAWNELNKNASPTELSNEWVIESSYKFQLSKNFSLTPDVQWMKNPSSLATIEKNNVVAGVRAILTL